MTRSTPLATEGVVVMMVDLLAAMRLPVTADVLVATDSNGASLAIPLRHAVSDPDARIVRDRTGDTRLIVAGWSEGPDAFIVRLITVMTFGEFVGGARS